MVPASGGRCSASLRFTRRCQEQAITRGRRCRVRPPGEDREQQAPEWVPATLTLEQAVSKLTMIPAVVHGLRDRGVLREAKEHKSKAPGSGSRRPALPALGVVTTRE